MIEDDIAKVELEGHTFQEAIKPVVKKEPTTLKEKIEKKIGVETPKEIPKEVTKESTKEKSSDS